MSMLALILVSVIYATIAIVHMLVHTAGSGSSSDSEECMIGGETAGRSDHRYRRQGLETGLNLQK